MNERSIRRSKARRGSRASRALRLFGTALLIVSLSTCQEFMLTNLLDGDTGQPLSIDPRSVNAASNQEIQFHAAGGFPPYRYSVAEGEGAIDPDSGLFVTPSSAGQTVVAVTDFVNKKASATVYTSAGEVVSTLIIQPTSRTVSSGAEFLFESVGGVRPHLFAITSPGSGNPGIDASSGLYTAGDTPGTDVVTVTDATGGSATATIMVVRDVDYRVASVTYTGGSTSGETVTGTFTFENAGTQDGTDSVTFQVYASLDSVLDASDVPIAGPGTTAPLAAGTSSGQVSFAGTWPTTPGTYVLFVKISDDAAASDLVEVTGPAPPDVDYSVTTVTTSGSTLAGGALTGSFNFQNAGTAGGSQTVYWTAYVSTDEAFDPGVDLAVDSGSASPLAATTVSPAIGFSGTWPQSAGTWYIIVRLIAGDDVDGTNNTAAGSAVTLTPPNVDYAVTAVTVADAPEAGGPLSGSFELENVGTAAGAATVNWVAYVSADTVLEIGVDKVVDAGTSAPLNPGAASGTLPVNGHWPSTPGSWYLLVAISAADDVNGSNDFLASAVVTTEGPAPADVDYSASAVTNTGATVAGGPLSGSFTLRNEGTAAGTSSVFWAAYLSSDTLLDASDQVVATGSTSAKAAGDSSSVSFTGTWPATAGVRHLIVDVSAADDVGPSNDVAVSEAIATILPDPPDVDYSVAGVLVGGETTTGSSFSGSFVYTNSGTDDGGLLVYWAAYLSQNTVLDHNTDIVVAAGSAPALGGSLSSEPVTFSGSWPEAGTWYLIVDVSAGDDTVSGNNTGSSDAVAVSPPPARQVDYAAATITHTGGTTAGQTFTGTFVYANVGSDNGTNSVYWTAYVSKDIYLEVGTDLVVDAGTQPRLDAGVESAPISFSGLWPSAPVPGTWYLLINVSAEDDVDPSNNTAAGGEIKTTGPAPPDVDYGVFTVTNTGDAVAGGPLTAEFAIRNVGSEDGSNPVFWSAYASTSASLDQTAAIIATGSSSGLAAGAESPAIPVSGTWPQTEAVYYIIIDLSASEDSTPENDRLTSGPVSLTAPDPPNVDYESLSVSNAGATTAGGALSGHFTITNAGTDGGSTPIFWSAYLSVNPLLDGSETIIGNGSTSALGAGATSSILSFSSLWPQTPGVWYLIVDITSADDVNAANNAGASNAVTTSAPNVDYAPLGVTSTGGTTGGKSLAGQFTVQNLGSDPGSSTVIWSAFASTQPVLDASATIVASGSTAALPAGSSSGNISFSGTWPATAATYYLIVELSAGDDVSPANNTAAGDAVIVNAPPPPDVDYRVVSVTNTGPTTAGGPLGAVFSMENIGTASGSSTVFWTAFLSSDTVLDSGDRVVDTGTEDALAAGASAAGIVIDGTWPSAEGTWHIIVDLSAPDDLNPANDALSGAPIATTAPPPADVDYGVLEIEDTGPIVAGESMTGAFSVTNVGSDPGSQTVHWAVYFSTDPVLDLGTDPVAAIGSFAPLGPGGTVSPSFGGTWPNAAGSYRLIVRVSADDDVAVGNNTLAGAEITTTEPDVDYVPAVVTPVSSPAPGQSAIAESFTVSNQGTSNGSAAVYWTAYVSTNATLDWAAVPIDSGTISPLTAGTSSAQVSIDNGTWPAVAESATYYLLVAVSAFDEPPANEGNNTAAAAFTINPRNVDYAVSSVVSSGGTTAGMPLSGSFTLTNIGTTHGAQSVFWTAYVSEDPTLDGDDVVVSSGSIAALSAGASASPLFSGMWPSTPGTWYMIVDVSVDEDANPLNDTAVSAAVTAGAPNVDYEVLSISSPVSVVAGQSLSESFTLENTGANHGARTIYWTVYVSTDGILGGDDRIIAAGARSALNSGLSASPAFTGTWPETSGTYHLIVTVSADDDLNTANDTLVGSAVTVQAPDVDYLVSSVTNTGGATAGGTIGGEFTYQNSGGNDGAGPVTWTAYVSSDPVVEVGVDQVIATGTEPPLASGAISAAVSFNGAWPSTAGTWHLLISLSAGDDINTGNNTGASEAVITSGAAPPNVDYEMLTVTNEGATIAGEALSGELTMRNAGADGGTNTVIWTAYVSSDPVLDGSDTVVATGTQPALDAGVTSAAIPFSGTWPVSDGTWYLIVHLSAADDVEAANDVLTSAAVTTTAPPPANVDYAVSDVTTPGSFVGGEALSGSFTVTNMGTDAGTRTVYWTAYISTDEVLGVGTDIVADAGSFPALAAGSGALPTPGFTGTWPTDAGIYYLIVRISADDDVADANNLASSAAISLSEPDVNYQPSAPTSVNSPAGGGSAINESFTITNNGTKGGSTAVYWTAYRSADAVLDASDTPVRTGSIPALAAESTSAAIAIDNGTWPVVESTGSYYLIVEVSAADEPMANRVDNVAASEAFTIDPPDIDYLVFSGPTTTNNPAVGGSAIGESFTIRNAGTDDGKATVYWTAYRSTDATLDIGDTPVASGTISGLAGGGTSAPIPIETGTWPKLVVSASYHLIVRLSAYDEPEVNSANNVQASAAITVNPPNVDYEVLSVTNTGGATAGGVLSGSFSFENIGLHDGVNAVYWTAYASENTVIDRATDIVISAGTEPALGSGVASAAIPFTGYWPSTPNTWHILVRIDADDDIDTSNNSGASAVVETTGPAPADVDYAVVSVSNLGPTTAGRAFGGELRIENLGSADGSYPVFWTAYISPDQILDGADTVAATGSTAPLPAETVSGPIAFEGTWPAAAGTWYLIVKLSAADDINAANDTLADAGSAVTPPHVDYAVSAVSAAGDPVPVAGLPLAGSFTITNIGAHDGTQSVFWSAYLSVDDVLNTATDMVVDSGIISALNASGTTSPTLSGTWPEAAGSYYLIVKASVDEDLAPGNDVAVSALITVSERDVDYVPSAPTTVTNPAAGGSSINETFTIHNLGAHDGRARVYWTAYYSTDDVFDIGDTPVDSGSISALASSDTPVAISIDNGAWPSVVAETPYYLIVVVSASDEPAGNTGNNNAGALFAITPPSIDYAVTAVTSTGGTKSGYPLSGAFTLTNNGGDPGSQTVHWTAYVSADASLTIGIDTVLDAGSVPALPAGGVATPSFSGTWPATAETWYLIVRASVDEDAATLDNIGVSDPILIVEPDVNYVTTAPSSVNNPAMSGSAINESFTIQNTGNDPGTATVYWTAYTSADETLDAFDTPIDSGTIAALGAGQISAEITIGNGSWPYVGVDSERYLIVTVSAYDEPEANEADNASSTLFTITAPQIDYVVTGVTTNGTPAATGAAINESFTVQNLGSSNGSAPVYWYAYYSPDPQYDASDTLIDSGSFVALASGESTLGIPITGTWPAESGEYYLVVRVSASDETEPNNNTGASGVFSVNAPELDYIVTSVSRDYPIGVTGGTVSETFSFKNAGGTAGTEDVSWTAYASADTTIDGGDTVIASGTYTPLPAGASITGIPIYGSWPATPGSYYLIVEVSVPSEEVPVGNNSAYSGTFTVNNPPDYAIVSATLPIVAYGGNIGEDITDAAGVHSFVIQEQSGFPGRQTITWTVYSSADAALDGGDTVIASGSLPALAAGAFTVPIEFSGPLPGTPSTSHLIITIGAGDDSNPGNNTHVSEPFFVWSPTGNYETDIDINKMYLNLADDYFVLLNPGDQVRIDGLMNQYVSTQGAGESSNDLFLIRTGPDTTSLSIWATWDTGRDDIELYLFGPEGNQLGSSLEGAVNSEPATPPWTVTGLSPNSVYYVNPDFFLGGGKTVPGGDPYQLFVVGGN